MFGRNWTLRSFASLALALLLINPAWADDDDDGHMSIDQQAQALVDQMTQDEKLQLTMGHPDAANPICVTLSPLGRHPFGGSTLRMGVQDVQTKSTEVHGRIQG